jgi:eukaryotic-like serine/threonine-protein kinase
MLLLKKWFRFFFETFIENQYKWSDSPDRADILWALGRLLHCPQIKARAGKWRIEKRKSVGSDKWETIAIVLKCFWVRILYICNKYFSMSLRRYVTSRFFVMQVLAALAIVFVLGFLLIHWLTYATNHGQVIVVPNLARLTEDQVEEKLDKLNLEYVLLDTVDYNPSYPKMSVVEQEPAAGMEVKEGRKVYIKLNSNGYTSVKLPNLIQQTFREVEATLHALHLEVGNKEYVPDIGKDMVLEIRLNGKILKPGDKVLKSSKIDLILGDGKAGFEDGEVDSTAVEVEKVDGPELQ